MLRVAGWIGPFACMLGAVSCGSDSSVSDSGVEHDAPLVLAEDTAATCNDRLDNDGDGFVDCADQDCWVLAACRRDAGQADRSGDARPGDDGHPADATPDQCKVHWDCAQGLFCYHGKCLQDALLPVFHCGKPGCPPGRWCVTQANTRDRCAEDPSYVCQDACDCGPAHCCVAVAALGSDKRCVKDEQDPWVTQGAKLPGAPACWPGIDPTYCCTSPDCYAGKFAQGIEAAGFRCYLPGAKADVVRSFCGGARCFGTACNCDKDRSCVDTLVASAPAGSTCGQLSGGSCVSNALAEAVFGWSPSDILPCCTTGCTAAGQLCDAGWRSGTSFAFERVVGQCQSCGNRTCEAWESPQNCAADCSCGDGACAVGEAAIDPLTGETACPTDCGSCGDGDCDALESPGTCAKDCADQKGVSLICNDGVCEPERGETPGNCPEDCNAVCPDALLQPPVYRFCGDGVCGDGVSRHAACDWGESETCRTCTQDCDACTWEKVRGASPLLRRDLRATWGSSASDVFAVGSEGTIIHFDGASWQPMVSGTEAELRSVWGSSSSNVLVGGSGVLLRYDGTRWREISSPTTGGINGLWGSSATDLFCVTGSGMIERFDGAGWTPITDPKPENRPWGSLRAVWGSSPSSVFAVGSAGTILHFDGTSVQQMTSGTTEILNSVWGSSSSDVYAVGMNATVLHYDGSTWQALSLPNKVDIAYAVWGSSSTNVFIQLAIQIYRFDGATWRLSATQMPSPGAALSGSSASDVFVVGFGGLIGRYVGPAPSLGTPEWRFSPAAPPALEGVSTRSATSALAVGRAGTILSYDSQGWHAQPAGTSENLRGVWASSASDAFAVGNKGTILHHDGASWQPMVAENVVYLGVWGSSPSDVFAVGTAGTISRFDGTSWSSAAPGATYLWGVWGSSSSDVFAVGGSGSAEVLHHDGASWQPMSVADVAQGHIRDAWGSSASNVYAVGGEGTIIRYDGTSWTAMSSGISGELRGVSGSSATSVVAVGGNVTSQDEQSWILESGGASWQPTRADLREENTRLCPLLFDVSITPAGEGFIVGSDGLIVKRCTGSAGCP